MILTKEKVGHISNPNGASFKIHYRLIKYNLDYHWEKLHKFRSTQTNIIVLLQLQYMVSNEDIKIPTILIFLIEAQSLK